MTVYVVAEFVGQNGLNLVGGVVGQQRIRQNDPAGVAQSGERGIRLLAFFRELPLVDAANASSRALPQPYQPLFQFLVFQGRKLVKDWKKNRRSQLRQQHK